MKFILVDIVLCVLILFSACSPQIIPTPTSTNQPTITPQLTLTPALRQPFTGKLFFDMNGSGLQDESSFLYDPERLADSRQPLQPDLNKAIKDYLSLQPDLNEGDLVSIPEPGLSGYQVCIENDCTLTNQDGSFEILNKTGSGTAQLKIIDPNKNFPALAMRYINEFKGTVVISSYEINGIQIPEQYLNDTIIHRIGDGIQIDEVNVIGLTQGFFNISQEFPLAIQFDLDQSEGVAIDWLGRKNNPPSDYSDYWFDNHSGIDFECEEGEIIKSFTPGEITSVSNNERGALWVEGIFTAGNTFHYGHLSVQLVKEGDYIYRNQIIGLCGHSGAIWPHIHFQLGNNSGPIDAFADLDNLIANTNLWTVFNYPYFR